VRALVRTIVCARVAVRVRIVTMLRVMPVMLVVHYS
jgi:hypothetical protein